MRRSKGRDRTEIKRSREAKPSKRELLAQIPVLLDQLLTSPVPTPEECLEKMLLYPDPNRKLDAQAQPEESKLKREVS